MIEILIPAVVALVIAWFLALQVAHAWSTGRWAATERYRLVADAVDSIVILALVRALAAPVGVWSWAWVIAVAIVGFGLAGAALRWRSLPWHAPKPKRSLDEHGATVETAVAPKDRRRQVQAGVYGVVGVAIVALCW
ncbi:hypothetical protein HOW07_11655 [Plantibacter sp. MCCC 1A11337]|uniref:hypothetical protein n=1 Tax=unclassified Plantibacter TaxID=2624265 RepID=UPI0007D92B46|nr:MULTISPECIES: hypothetical protein [unclassified Plantibacter]NUJ88664.1 hypothetical protein [Plantibacter sp. MCCC 1A11337]OAN26906.1 hypothetical protein A4X17_10060 [Plantibacter sp. H53]OII37790.1 hypothetical protein BIU99_10305 [Plantibacter sp. MMLR14_011]